MSFMETLNSRQKKDICLIGSFVELYCDGKHGGADRHTYHLPTGLGVRSLCPDCSCFMEYAVMKRLKCPLEEEKPTCRRCRIHCYAPPQRQLVREIMAYSGRWFILKGRLDYLWHYLF